MTFNSGCHIDMKHLAITISSSISLLFLKSEYYAHTPSTKKCSTRITSDCTIMYVVVCYITANLTWDFSDKFWPLSFGLVWQHRWIWTARSNIKVHWCWSLIINTWWFLHGSEKKIKIKIPTSFSILQIKFSNFSRILSPRSSRLFLITIALFLWEDVYILWFINHLEVN